MKSKSNGSAFPYSRVLGRRPQPKASVIWSATLGDLTTSFGPPEIEIFGNDVIVFWNFADNAHSKLFSCYAVVPMRCKPTANQEVEIAITGGYSEPGDFFANRFMDFNADVYTAKQPSSFVLGRKTNIPVISTLKIAARA